MIIIDSREPTVFKNMGDTTTILPKGDIMIQVNDNKFLIERKTLTDYWSSLKSGRLNEQLETCDALLLDIRAGFYSIKDYTDINRFWDTVNGVSIHHIVLLGLSLDQIRQMIRRYEKQMEINEFRIFDGRVLKKDIKRDILPKVRVLSGFDHIGEEKAKILLKGNSNSLMKTFLWAISDVKSHNIEGIGDITINSIKRTLLDEGEIND